MLLYEHERTDLIVEHLRKSKPYVMRLSCFLATILSGTAAVGACRLLANDLGSAVIAGLSFAVIGYLLAAFANIWFEVAVEWMCQMLVAQGQQVEALARQKRHAEPPDTSV